jgi:di/tricarboxylate transporter
MPGHDRREVSEESLEQEATFILEESRMVLPGIQALFGFRLIAVFNQRFAEKLAPSEQILHLLAFALVAVATALIITPAAYHRQAEREQVSEYFVRVASRLLTVALLFLMTGTSLDAFLVARIVTGVAQRRRRARAGARFLRPVVRVPAHRAADAALRSQAYAPSQGMI